MKTSVLKKAVLTNKRLWTTTITWATILSEDKHNITEIGKTCIITEQKYYRNRKKSFTCIEEFNREDFDKAYDIFHQRIKKWL